MNVMRFDPASGTPHSLAPGGREMCVSAPAPVKCDTGSGAEALRLRAARSATWRSVGSRSTGTPTCAVGYPRCTARGPTDRCAHEIEQSTARYPADARRTACGGGGRRRGECACRKCSRWSAGTRTTSRWRTTNRDAATGEVGEAGEGDA